MVNEDYSNDQALADRIRTKMAELDNAIGQARQSGMKVSFRVQDVIVSNVGINRIWRDRNPLEY